MDSVSYSGLKCYYTQKCESSALEKQLDTTSLQHNINNLIFIASTNRNSEIAHKQEQPQCSYSPIVSSSLNYLLFPALLFIVKKKRGGDRENRNKTRSFFQNDYNTTF